MNMKYCLPIIKSESKQVLEIISKNQKSYDYFEVWLDYIQDLNLDFIKNLNKKYNTQLIFLFRRQDLEAPKIDLQKRLQIIDILENSDCLVDLDISQQKELHYIMSKRINLIFSYHNYKETPTKQKMEEIIKLMTKQKAHIYKISTFCNKDDDALALIDLLTGLKGKQKWIVLGMGIKGTITRIAGAILGNEINFTPLSHSQKSALGQLTKDELEKILAKIKICYFVADPVGHSLSPKMHQAGYKALGIEKDFLYLADRVKSKDLKKYINKIRIDSNFRGASISIPHKIKIMRYLDEIDTNAKKIGAVNTVVKNGKKLKGYNTDYLGILNPLKQRINLKNKNAAIIGAGGAARAAIFALISQGVKITIFNRDIKKAKKLAQEFNCQFDSLNNIGEISKFDIVIHATKVGLHPSDLPLINKKLIRANQVIFDVVYSKDYPQTKLIKQSIEKKAKTISGVEMLLYQGIAQFELFTKRKAPLNEMKKLLI